MKILSTELICAMLCLCAPAVNAQTQVTDMMDRVVLRESETGERNAAPFTDKVKTQQDLIGTRNYLMPLASNDLFEKYIVKTTGSWPEAVAIGDLNNDGLNDVALVTNFYFDPDNDHKLFIFTQNPDGTLNDPIKYAATLETESVDIGDMNGDGLNDVVVGGAAPGIFYQNSDGTLSVMANVNCSEGRFLKLGDFNNDGRMDLVTANWGSNRIKVCLQTASGGLGPETSYDVNHGGYDELEVGDVNNDGRDDVIVMSGQYYAYANIGILLQNPAGKLNSAVYRDLGLNENTSGVGIGDINGNNLQDIVVSYGGNKPASHIATFKQNTSGTISTTATSYPSYDIPESIEIADVNSDGLDDVITLHGGWNTMGVYIQNASGGLEPEVRYGLPYASHYNPQGLAIGDINNDGYPDALVASYNAGLVIFYHKKEIPASGKNWALYE